LSSILIEVLCSRWF